MKTRNGPWMVAIASVLAGCTSHVVFVESSHLGVKAAFEPNTPTPAVVDVGWKRSVAAVVPKQSAIQPTDKRSSGEIVTDCPAIHVEENEKGEGVTAKIESDPNELMSLYTSYEANIGFGDPVTVHHFLATGLAATSLMANDENLRHLRSRLSKDRAKQEARARGENVDE